MALSLTHTFVSAISDGADTTVVRPSNWNAQHTITADANSVLGRAAGSSGAVAPIVATNPGDVLTFTAGSLSFQAPAAGAITVGTTAIASGTNTRILFDNSGVVGEYTLTGTGTVVVMQDTPTLTTPVLGVATGTSLRLGAVSTTTGQLFLANAASVNLTTLQAGNAAAARTYTWPTDFGAAGTVLTDAAGNGTLSWAAGGGSSTLTANTTATSGYSAGQFVYSDGSVIQASTGLTFTTPGQLAIATGTITTSSKPALSVTQTWNDGAVVFTGLKVNITATAASTGSMLMDLQVGGSSYFSFEKQTGPLAVFSLGGSTASGPTIAAGYPALIAGAAAYSLWIAYGGNAGTHALNAGGIILGSDGATAPYFGAQLNGAGTAGDVFLFRDAANTWGQRNGTHAQTFRVYNTFTDASNYERGVFDWTTTANTLRIGTQNAGTGSARGVAISTAGTDAITITSAALVALPQIGSDATHTDSSVCQDTTTHALYSGSGAAGICLGTSSLRFKTDVAPLQAGLADVLRIAPVSYRYKKGYGESDHTLYGFTAEQMVDAVPGIVRNDAEGQPNSVDWAGLLPVLVQAIKEQQIMIDELRERLH